MTLKIGSMSPKSYQLVPSSQQCICASLVKIRPLVQKITCGNEATRTPTGSEPKTICLPPLRLGDIKKFRRRAGGGGGGGGGGGMGGVGGGGVRVNVNEDLKFL